MNLFILQDTVYIILLVALSVPLGLYISRIMEGQRVFLTPVFSPFEKLVYKLSGIRESEEMTAPKYALSILLFSAVGMVFVFLLQLLQGKLPLNPEKLGGVSLQLAFNTAASFVSNTNWQAYAGESTMSYLTQSLGLTVQNFVSAATGIAVLFALIRGFVRKQEKTLGNFWADLTRITIYILIPLAVILSLLLVTQGVVQSFDSYETITRLEDGTTGTVPLGPAASQIAIKQLGTNGGGFFGANSAFPLENPTPVSNLLEMISILLIPAALCVTFGKAVKDRKQGRSIYIVMVLFFVAAAAAATAGEVYTAPSFEGVALSGNMEGKEVIHGVGTSALWSVATTAASNGAVNAMHDSLTPVGGMIPLFLMQLGEIIFGGAGSGLYAMIGFVILTVFIAGLMVGRTPEYLGKKIEPFDMKMVCIMILVPPLMALIGTAAGVMMPEAGDWIRNPGAHGFSEILYGFTSMSNNNGSAFAGFQGNTLFTNITGGLIMLAARFVPMSAALCLAGNLAGKKSVAASEGTLSTTNGMFVGLLVGVILLVAALSFLPALALGPIADALKSSVG